MITITNVKVTSFVFKERRIQWEIEDTLEDLSTYNIEIYRAEYAPQDDYDSSMELMGTAVASDFDYVDTISGMGNDLFRSLYYALRPEKGGEYGEFYKPVTHTTVPDFVARAAIMQQNIGFRQTGQPVAILKKKTFGTMCSNMDTTIGRHLVFPCDLCFDTGFLGGFYAPIYVNGIINAAVKYQQQREFGEWQNLDAVLTLENYPEVRPDDVIIDALNRRWVILNVRPTLKGLYTITQNCHIRIITKDSNLYNFNIDQLI